MVAVMRNEIVERGLSYPNRQLELFENFHSVAADMYISLEFPEVSFPGGTVQDDPGTPYRGTHAGVTTPGIRR